MKQGCVWEDYLDVYLEGSTWPVYTSVERYLLYTPSGAGVGMLWEGCVPSPQFTHPWLDKANFCTIHFFMTSRLSIRYLHYFNNFFCTVPENNSFINVLNYRKLFIFFAKTLAVHCVLFIFSVSNFWRMSLSKLSSTVKGRCYHTYGVIHYLLNNSTVPYVCFVKALQSW